MLKIQNNLQTTKYIMIVCGLFEHASMLFRGLFQCPHSCSEGQAAVNKLIEEFRTQYCRRPSMMRELNKLR